MSEGDKAYFRERLRNRVYNVVLAEYFAQKECDALSKADIARRLGKSPAQITRLLAAPGNWTIDTISDLLLAIGRAELELGMRPIAESSARNAVGPDWLTAIPVESAPHPQAFTRNIPVSIQVTPPGISFPQANRDMIHGRVTA